MPDTITGRKEGTRFATDVQIYDPVTKEVIGSLAEVVAESGTPVDAPTQADFDALEARVTALEAELSNG